MKSTEAFQSSSALTLELAIASAQNFHEKRMDNVLIVFYYWIKVSIIFWKPETHYFTNQILRNRSQCAGKWGLIKTSSGQVPVSIGGYLQVYTFGVRDRKRHVLNQHITVPAWSNSSWEGTVVCNKVYIVTRLFLWVSIRGFRPQVPFYNVRKRFVLCHDQILKISKQNNLERPWYCCVNKS